MTKTNFAQGVVVTPEFLNAINNPVYSENPQQDGEIPVPPQIATEKARAEAAEGALGQGIAAAAAVALPLIDSKTFDSASRAFGDLDAYLSLTPSASPAGVAVAMDDNYSNSPTSILLVDTDPTIHDLVSGISVASIKGRGCFLGIDGVNTAFGGAPRFVSDSSGGVGNMVTPSPNSLAIRIPARLRRLSVAAIAPPASLPILQLLLVTDQPPEGNDPYSFGFRLSLHLQHNTSIYLGVHAAFPDSGAWYRAHGSLGTGSPRVLLRPGSAPAYHTRAEFFVRVSRGEPELIGETLFPGPVTYSISRLLTGDIATTNTDYMLIEN